MKKSLALPVISVLGGIVAFALRLLQNCTGFESGTGLPISGNFASLALMVLLALLFILFCILAWQQPKESGETLAFPTVFSTDNAGFLMLPVAGILLIALSGIADMLIGLNLHTLIAISAPLDISVESPALSITSAPFSSRTHLLLGILSILSAAGLFHSAAACRHKDDSVPRTINSAFLLIPPVTFVVRLVLTYRSDSVDPVLAAYYVELLALVFLTLGFYRLSSFAYQAGCSRRFSLYSATAVTLCFTALADGGNLSSLLLFIGGGLTLLGFLLLRLSHASIARNS